MPALQTFFVPNNDRNHPLVQFYAFCFLFVWYVGMILQGIIAVDRSVP